MLEKLGIAEKDAAKIRDVSAEAILNAQLAVPTVGMGLAFAPIVDGTTVPVQPLEAVKNGVAREIELVIGSNRDEAKLFNAVAPRNPIDEGKFDRARCQAAAEDAVQRGRAISLARIGARVTR